MSFICAFPCSLWSYIFSPSPYSMLPHLYSLSFSLFQPLSHIWIFATPWTIARQASLSITNSNSHHWPHIFYADPSLFIVSGPIFCAAPSLFIIQFSLVTQSCPTLCNPMNCSRPGLPVHHKLLGFTQTHVHWDGDAIQPSYPLSSPFPPFPNLSQHQGLFKWVSSSH